MNQVWRYLQAVLGGALMGLSFLHPFLWWTIIPGLALVHESVVVRAASLREAALLGFSAGCVKSLLVLLWLFSAFPLAWVGAFPSWVAGLAILCVWISGGLVLGTALMIYGACMYHVRSYRWSILSAPFVLVLAEVFGSIVYALAAFGPGGSLGIHPTYGYAGYALAGHGILGLAALVGGVYTMTAVVCVLALFVREGVRKYRGLSWSHRGLCVAICIGVLGSYSSTVPQREETTMRVVAINTQFPKVHDLEITDKRMRARAQSEAFRAALKAEPAVIVFPEGASGLSVFGSPANVFSFTDTVGSSSPIVIDTETVSLDTSVSLMRARYYDTNTYQVYDRYKSYLVPFGEYMPYYMEGMLKLFVGRERAEQIVARLAFRDGSVHETQVPDALPGILFCSENISPVRAREEARQSDFGLMVHPVSHAWFHDPDTLWYQEALILRTQARMTRTPIVVASNMWEPRAYNARGYPVSGTVISDKDGVTVVEYAL